MRTTWTTILVDPCGRGVVLRQYPDAVHPPNLQYTEGMLGYPGFCCNKSRWFILMASQLPVAHLLVGLGGTGTRSYALGYMQHIGY